jgi:hypothetical protein
MMLHRTQSSNSSKPVPECMQLAKENPPQDARLLHVDN